MKEARNRLAYREAESPAAAFQPPNLGEKLDESCQGLDPAHEIPATGLRLPNYLRIPSFPISERYRSTSFRLR